MISILAGMNLDLQTAIIFIAILGLVWAFFLITHKRGNLSANKFLALLIAVLAVFVLRRIADLNEGSFYLFLYFISHGSIYLIGPAIYFHIQNITGQHTSKKQVWTHFIPALLAVLLMAVLFFFRLKIDKIEDFSLLKTASILFISLQVIHLVSYLILSRKLVFSYAKKCETYYSSISRINLKWIKHLMLITSVLGAGIFILHVMIVSGGYYQINNNADLLFLALLAIIILSIIYKSWKQPEIVSGIYEETGKYKNSPLSDADSVNLCKKLECLLEEEKTYLTQELNLGQLAKLLGTQTYLLSQLLNESYGQNFFNFINGHRINFAKQKIQDGYLSTRTLESIAYESGFNSKSTFNRAFKKRVGCSPKEFHRTIKQHSTIQK
ncbi:MAG: AraC family transcriptional regulator [Cyclobacteriaceae bacterium]